MEVKLTDLFIVLLVCVVVTASPPTAGKLLPYPLSTRGNQIIDSSGTPVRLSCIGWSWVSVNSGPWSLLWYPYKPMLQAVANGGFNCIRMTTYDMGILNNPVVTQVDQHYNSDIYGKTYRDMLVAIVNYGGSLGLRFIIDSHNNEGGDTQRSNWGAQQNNGLWYDVGGTTDNTDGGGNAGHVSDAVFTQIWQIRANLFKGSSYVIGYDLRNEPLAYGGMCTWGDNGVNDIRAMYQRVGNAIHAIDPNKLIICEGPQNYGGMFNGNLVTPFGDLSNAGRFPVNLNVANKVVYSVHVYPTDVSNFTPDQGPAVIPYYNQAFGYLVNQNIAPLFIGEMGTNMEAADDQAYFATLSSWMNGDQGAAGGPTFSGNQQGVSWSWWDLEDVHHGTGAFGILNSYGNAVDPTVQAYWSKILPFVISTPATPKPTPTPTASPSGTVVRGAGATIRDVSGNTWQITSGKQISVNGAIDLTTANVIALVYVRGLLWQENTDFLWWTKTSPSAAWVEHFHYGPLTSTVYTDSMQNGWVDGSWSSNNRVPCDTSKKHSGTCSYGITPHAWDAIYFYSDGFNVNNVAGVQFWINGGAAGGQLVNFTYTVYDPSINAARVIGPNLHVTSFIGKSSIPANTWTQGFVPTSYFPSGTTLTQFWFQADPVNPNGYPKFYVDDVSLVLK